jgi:hypothetical protein
MDWIPISERHLLSGVSGQELDAYRDAASVEGQPDPVATLMETTIDEVRGAISGNRANVLGEAGTLPPSLVRCFISLATVYLLGRIPGVTIDQQRLDARDRANSTLDAVRRGDQAVELPSVADDGRTQAIGPMIRRKHRQFTRASEDGI